MIINNIVPNLSMGQKLKMFRELNNLSQEQLGQKLSVSDKTISAWETEDREINLPNAKAICELFNIPNSYFVFNENFDKVDTDTKNRIQEYLKNYEFTTKIEKMLSFCKLKIENDGLPLKKEYLPTFNYENKFFASYGIFDKNSLPIKIERNTGTNSLANCYMQNIDDTNLEKISYSSAALIKFGLFDILQRFNNEKVELVDLANCNNIDVFKSTLNKMKTKKYTRKNIYSPFGEGADISKEYVQEQLNKVLEELNPNLTKFWEIITFLIDNGAYYTKQLGYGDDVTCFHEVKDESKTNIIYRIAKDKILK